MSLSKSSISSFIFAVILILASLPVLADSHVRIVRLSYIEGGVQVSHAGAQQYQKAMTNLPIAEGMKLKTADDGKAEVEFEDGSTLRIVPNSAVEFSQLSLRDSGSKVTNVEVVKGTAYLNFIDVKDDEFSLKFGDEKIDLTHPAHLRVDLDQNTGSVSIFKGLIQIESPSGSIEVKKNQTASFNGSHDGSQKLAKNIHPEPWDAWDDQQNEYHDRYAAKSYNSYSPYAYGTTDLSYYGNFYNYPGYGMLWSPYFADASWSPFMDGAWMFYPGAGYGWISAYPWGWTPYHYGSWIFVPGRGWGWQPGGSWTALSMQPRVLNAPKGFVAPQAPTSGTSTVVMSRGSVSTFTGSKFVVRNNSAGLGLPRGEFDNMAKLSQKAEAHGSVVASPRSEPEMLNSSNRAGMAGMAESRTPEQRTGNVAHEPAPSGMSMPNAGASSGGAARK